MYFFYSRLCKYDDSLFLWKFKKQKLLVILHWKIFPTVFKRYYIHVTLKHQFYRVIDRAQINVVCHMHTYERTRVYSRIMNVDWTWNCYHFLGKNQDSQQLDYIVPAHNKHCTLYRNSLDRSHFLPHLKVMKDKVQNCAVIVAKMYI